MKEITSVKFVKSSPAYAECPEPNIPEYSFIGRSNVGKSSLINLLVNQEIAKTSATPGKTQLINHFIVDNTWYLVDLPGYGYAKPGVDARIRFQQLIENYLNARENLVCTFVLIDIRHEPQKIDLDFFEWLGLNDVPFVIAFTKCDKLSTSKIKSSVNLYKKKLMEFWEELPEIFITSAETKTGKDEMLSFIDQYNSEIFNSK